MKLTVRHCAFVVAVYCLSMGSVSAEEHKLLQKSNNKVQEKGLKFVMQGLLKDTQLISQGIFLQDLNKIKLAAADVANHPTPGMTTMKKVIGYLGPEMAVFKEYDMKVHHLAVEIEKAATDQNMSEVVSKYHQLVDGCLSCHGQFKQRISKILN